MTPGRSFGFVDAGAELGGRMVASRTLGLGLLAVSCTVLAQSSSEQFEITRQTLTSGGGPVSGTEFTVTGTVGQPEMTLQSMTGTQFQISGGFWARGTAPPPTGDALFF